MLRLVLRWTNGFGQGKLGWLLGWLLGCAVVEACCWSSMALATVERAASSEVPSAQAESAQAEFTSPATGPTTTVAEWVELQAQQAAPTQITSITVNTTDSGLDLVLQSEPELLSLPEPTTVGNALIIDVPNAVLVGDPLQQANPTPEIALISVANLSGNRVRIAITGTAAAPTAEVQMQPQGVRLAVKPGSATESETESIQVVVTGEQEEGYSPSEAATATRTDTPLRDIPQSIQVVPRQVIEDQAITRTSDALRNVSGVSVQRDFGDSIDIFTIRGFSAFQSLRNGARFESAYLSPDNVERIEVLKGPASVLYGQFEPGGVVNYITEQPLSDPYYSFELTGGSYSLYRPAIDISGPLTADQRLLYRLNVSYENAESYIDFVNGTSLLIAPSLSYRIGDSTNITLEYEYLEREQTFF